MRQTALYIFLLGFVLCGTTHGQQDSLQLLPEVVISDVKLRDFSQGVQVEKIVDTLLTEDLTFLTDVLRDRSPIFFRENGPGGVSSASYRGTNAQQTAVVWNGIAINSQLTGQTDFNTIAAYNYDQISVRSGGGSIPYGSGAVGGSVHLENRIRFGDLFENQVLAGYGSFDTRIAHVKTTYATEQLYLNIAGDYLASENDFKYLETSERNENGQFENANMNLNMGILLTQKRLRPQHILKLHHNSFLGERQFSGTLIAPSDDRYQDRNTRTLLSWEQLGKRYEGRLSAAHLFEQFRFFPTENDPSKFSFGKASRFVGSYDGTLRPDQSKFVKGIFTVEHIAGDGTSLQNISRQLFSAVILYSHKFTSKFSYDVQLRQEFTEDYENPFLVGVGGNYAFAKAYNISFNASRNYRIPTFNDLYWQGSGAAGNPDLIPETSLQAEIGQQVTFKNLRLKANVFYINTEDLILWQPNNQNIWSPQNLRASRHYGTELTSSYTKVLGAHNIRAEGRYTYTIAQNKETGNALAYVPKQQVSLRVCHSFKNWTTLVQGAYTDTVFVTSDEGKQLADYFILNASVAAQLVHKQAYKVNLRLSLNNALNRNYQIVQSRPNPGRNILIQTTYIF